MTNEPANEPRIRVLIVEDEALLAEEIRERLQHVGHTVVGAVDNGLEALSIAEQTRPDLVLMDIRIKGQIDGIETAARIYEKLQIPIVYLTAHADEATVRRATATGQFGYVIKPFQERELLVAVDIAAHRHKVEKSLQEGRLTYLTILGSVTDAVIATDENARVRFLNPVAETLTGWRLEEANRVPVEQMLKLVDLTAGNEVSDPLPPILREDSGAALDQVLRLINRNGHGTLVEVTSSSVRDFTGRLIGRVFVLRDVTEHRRAEERFRNLLESAPDAMVIMDANGKIQMVNSQTEKMFGYPRRELIGKMLEMLIRESLPGQPRTLCGRFHDHLQPGPSGAGLELFGRRKDGTEFPIEMRNSPLESEEGLVVSTAIRDLTERNRTETALRELHKMDAVGQLAAGVAHEYNNLLHAIIGYAELMLVKMDATNPYFGNLNQIKTAGLRASVLTRQLLAFSRKQILEPRILDLNNILTDFEKMLARLLGEDIEIAMVLTPATVFVKADLGLIKQVITSLVVNARDAMPQGGKLTIESANLTPDQGYLRAHPDVLPGDYVRLSIHETGTGMTDAIKVRLFEPSFTTKPVGQGTGLGLATCYGIVKQSGGHIVVESSVGKGSTFHIFLPRVTNVADQSIAPPPSEVMPRGHETILLVEEEPLVREVVSLLLKELGYQVFVVKDGEAALRHLHDNCQADLLITDVIMPKKSGTQLAVKIRQLYPEVRILFITGYTDNTSMQEVPLNPGETILQKPFRSITLAQKVREVLDTPRNVAA